MNVYIKKGFSTNLKTQSDSFLSRQKKPPLLFRKGLAMGEDIVNLTLSVWWIVVSLCAVFCCHYSDSCWESNYKHQDLVGSSFILNHTDFRGKKKKSWEFHSHKRKNISLKLTWSGWCGTNS